jgi:hypothetical protein
VQWLCTVKTASDHDSISVKEQRNVMRTLSPQKHLDKAVNKALVAETIEACANEHEQWIMYGRMGNHQSLDKF